MILLHLLHPCPTVLVFLAVLTLSIARHRIPFGDNDGVRNDQEGGREYDGGEGEEGSHKELEPRRFFRQLTAVLLLLDEGLDQIVLRQGRREVQQRVARRKDAHDAAEHRADSCAQTTGATHPSSE